MTGDKRKSTINRFLNGTRDFLLLLLPFGVVFRSLENFRKSYIKLNLRSVKGPNMRKQIKVK